MRTLAVLLCLSVVIMAAAPAWCHAPSDISIAITGSDVNVTVSHPVGDPQTHFVKVIRISVNDAPFASQDFTQQTGNVQKANFTIPDLKKGDIVTAEAVCSRSGSLTRSQAAGS
ncbi:MAG TPA: hypothetical protein PLJ26_00710 [Candidatus Omnitrophota bacterium]|nr:hypothetical protein [Candidatus Omnitrophota bacterium]